MNRPIHLSVHFALLQVFVVIVGVFLVVSPLLGWYWRFHSDAGKQVFVST